MPEFDLIPPDALADLRALNESNLPHLATISIETQSGARVGGALVDPAPQEIAADVPCRLSPSGSGSQLDERDQTGTTSRWTVAFAAGYVVPENATAVISGATNGQAWQRTVQILSTIQTRAFASMAKYDAVDLGAPSR